MLMTNGFLDKMMDKYESDANMFAYCWAFRNAHDNLRGKKRSVWERNIGKELFEQFVAVGYISSIGDMACLNNVGRKQFKAYIKFAVKGEELDNTLNQLGGIESVK